MNPAVKWIDLKSIILLSEMTQTQNVKTNKQNNFSLVCGS